MQYDTLQDISQDIQCPICFGEIDLSTGNCLTCIARETFKEQKTKNRLNRKHRNRIINKRLHIIKDVWCDDENFYSEQPNRLYKHNLSCNCWLCKGEKKAGIDKFKYQQIYKQHNYNIDNLEYKEDFL